MQAALRRSLLFVRGGRFRFFVPSSDAPNPVSHLCGYGRPPLEFRMLGRQWISAEPVSNDFFAWYKPGIRRPVSRRSVSVEVNLLSVGHVSRIVSVGREDWEPLHDQFDDVLVQSYGYPSGGRQLLPSHAPLYNKLVGGKPTAGLGCLTFEPIGLRNIRIGRPAIADGLHIGEVV